MPDAPDIFHLFGAHPVHSARQRLTAPPPKTEKEPAGSEASSGALHSPYQEDVRTFPPRNVRRSARFCPAESITHITDRDLHRVTLVADLMNCYAWTEASPPATRECTAFLTPCAPQHVHTTVPVRRWTTCAITSLCCRLRRILSLLRGEERDTVCKRKTPCTWDNWLWQGCLIRGSGTQRAKWCRGQPCADRY